MAAADTDGDGVAEDCDLCTGNDASGDTDSDGTCDDMDTDDDDADTVPNAAAAGAGCACNSSSATGGLGWVWFACLLFWRRWASKLGRSKGDGNISSSSVV